MDDRIEKANEVTARAEGRISESGLDRMNINSYIASLTDMNNHPLTLPNPEEAAREKQSLERAIGMFSYLRDTHDVKTVGEAWDALKQGKVKPEIVKLWVEEGMAVNPGEFDSIAQGYPNLRQDLQRIRDQKLDKYK